MEIHVEKTKNRDQINKALHIHMYKIHGLYLKKKQKITREVINNYLLSLNAKQIMHLINILYRNQQQLKID